MKLAQAVAECANEVYRVDVPVGPAARRLAIPVSHVRLHGATNKRDLLRAISRALRFPVWFGGNWDALEECLLEEGTVPGTGLVLEFDSIGQLVHHDPDALRTLVEVLGDVAADYRTRKVPFLVCIVDNGRMVRDLPHLESD